MHRGTAAGSGAPRACPSHWVPGSGSPVSARCSVAPARLWQYSHGSGGSTAPDSRSVPSAGTRPQRRSGARSSGPEQAALVDLAAFLLLNARLGRPTPMALTSSLQISYLSRPRPGLLRTHAKMAKSGRSLCVVLAELRDSAGTLAATATVTLRAAAGPPVRAAEGGLPQTSSRAASE
ncbi:PaaI family thioesterase [Streptomyces sp. NPDC017673]|uniref:PaaI family thioesterase n=1 Tax=unclassified Streptomyces TaxID=2593676 RepID=UPI00379B586E